LVGWEPEYFEGKTQYKFAHIGSRTALRAHCHTSASGLVLKWEIDLTKTPILYWPWRVDCIYPGLDEETKAGDDYPARIYVIHNGGWLKWRSRAIDYVWSSSQPVHKAWPNAFVIQAMMAAVRSSPPAAARAVVYAMAQHA
jgi:hypothetical protein